MSKFQNGCAIIKMILVWSGDLSGRLGNRFRFIYQERGELLKKINYTTQIVRSRRKTLALEITSTGKVLIRASYSVPEWQINDFVQEKEGWIQFHLQKKLADGKILEEKGRFTEDEIDQMIRLAKSIIPQKVAYYARVMRVTYGSISIRKQKTRWGSCSRKGNLNFNCLLMMAPPHVLDYVVVHELSHRLEMNHSARFWGAVEKVLPDYKEARAWLREYGNQFMLRMHGIEE